MTNDDVLKDLRKRNYDNLVVVAWDNDDPASDTERSVYVAATGKTDTENALKVSKAAKELVDCLRERAR